MQLTCVQCNKQIIPKDPHAAPEGALLCGEECSRAYHSDPNNRHRNQMFTEPLENGHHQTELSFG